MIRGKARISGGILERSNRTDCKSVGIAFQGSNPCPTTIKKTRQKPRLFCFQELFFQVIRPKNKGNYILNFFFLLFLLHCHLECLSVCGQYRPNRAPNPESAVGSRVRPARQSRDCLRGRPLRTPVLSAMVCSAYGVGTAHPCTGAYGVTRRIPALPETFLSA